MPSQKIFLLKAQTGLSALTSSGGKELTFGIHLFFYSFLFQTPLLLYSHAHREERAFFTFFSAQREKRRLKRQRSSSIYAPGTRKCIAWGRTCVPASSPFAVRICAGDTWNRLAMPNNSSPCLCIVDAQCDLRVRRSSAVRPAQCCRCPNVCSGRGWLPSARAVTVTSICAASAAALDVLGTQPAFRAELCTRRAYCKRKRQSSSVFRSFPAQQDCSRQRR